MNSIMLILALLVSESFPELSDAYSHGRIQLHEFVSDAYYLKTSLVKRNVYSIDINRKIFENPPSPDALKGILAHELVHILDYETGSDLQLLGIGLGLTFRPSVYERYTDERAFLRGYADGISEFRKWIYARLSEKELKRKKKRYYTPEEIELWKQGHTGRKARKV